ncbi:MAG: GNAT family N-acetyltransferase [Chloroflexi bacterium]|nr:GNAT family N-acetyltransferase [Chloroflexota bacterium]
MIDSQFSVLAMLVGGIVMRQAAPSDARDIADLVSSGEREGQLLPRSLEAIQEDIADWVVAVDRGRVVGVGSLVEMGPTLVEVRSLAVAPEYRHNGIGRELVQALVELAKARRVPNVFALTRAVPFFEKLGFHVTVKEDFPEKVWRDCLICPVRSACDEVAVVRSVDAEQAH